MAARGSRGFPVLVATDGSRHARAAVATTVGFPWPRGSRAHGVVARGSVVAPGSVAVRAALERSLAQAAGDARRMLARRWRGAAVAIVDGPPVEAILRWRRRTRAGAIVLGSRGQGLVSRLLLGSVSRGVVRQAPCPVLVVKGRVTSPRRFTLGLDGSAHGRRAAAFLARLAVPRGGEVTLLRVVEPMRPPSMALLVEPVRGVLAKRLRAQEAARIAAATRQVARTASALRQVGWTVRTRVETGVPLDTLLRVARTTRANVLVVGARGVGGVERLLLGSVAEGALVHAPLPILVVR